VAARLFDNSQQYYLLCLQADAVYVRMFDRHHFVLVGVFTMRDMYEQFQNIMKMGPFSQIMVSAREWLCCLYNDYLLQ
jgi:hypothetical protein